MAKSRNQNPPPNLRARDEHPTLEAAVDAFIQFLELRTKTQYAQETAPSAGIHNWIPIYQR